MSRLSDKKLALLQSDYGSSLWYITKQNCSFRDLMMMASILERWNDDPNESFESFFNRVKTETKYADYIGNSPHRALKNCEFYGIMSPSSSLKAAYTSSNLTDVYYTVKSLCNEDYEKTNKYQQIIDKQIENMNISIDGNNLKPVLFTLKVMLIVGDATGKYEISLQEFKLFVCTAKKWYQYFESAESILRSREDSGYLTAALQKYDIANDTRFNLVFKNLSYVESTTKSIIIDQNKIEEVRKKVAEFEVGEELEKKNNRKNDFKFNMPLQQIFYGAPGTGKSHRIDEIVKNNKYSSIRTTFHPDSDYSTFVGAYKPVMDDVDMKVIPVVLGESGTVFNKNEGSYQEKRIMYKFVMQAFTKAYLAAWKKYVENPQSPQFQFLVIEEINRGNCAQIFGDLFQLLDRGDNGFSCYPIEADTDLQLAISDAFKKNKEYKLGKDIDVEGVIWNYVSNYDSTLSKDIQEGRILLLPKNLYIWATMNTSDQSLFPIDSAFKRRWDWQYMKITEGKDKKTEMPLGWKILVCDKEEDRVRLYDWWRFLQLINKKIFDATQSADKQMGYFFAKANEVFNGEKVGKIIKGGDFESLPSESISMEFISAETFVNKVLFYLWTDVLKDNEYDEIASLMKDGDKDLSFPDFFDESGKEISPAAVRAFLDNVMKEEDILCDVAEWELDINDNNTNGASFKPKSVIFKITDNISDKNKLYLRAKGWWRMAEKRANINETEYAYVYSTPLKEITACYKITEWNKNQEGRFGFEGDAVENDAMIGQPVEPIAHVRGQVVFYPK